MAHPAAHRALFVLAAASAAAAGIATLANGGATLPTASPPGRSASFVPASFRFTEAASAPAAEPVPAAPSAAAPISLTAGDGTGLRLVSLEAEGVLEPPLAFTELRLAFDNPRDQVLEGRFRIVLPPGAAISRFAMKIGDRWQEGEVVERQRARRAYEDFLHRRQDPALLEQEAGNEFSARVFPIPARGRKELVVSYSHALERADQPYRLPLLGLPEIGTLDVRVLLGERPVAGEPASNLGGAVRDRRLVELHRRSWVPDRDLEIAQDALGERAGLRRDELVLVRVDTQVDPEPQEIAGLWLLVDSSASRTLGWADQVRRVGELVAGLGAGAGAATPVGIAVFDQEVVPVYEGPAGGFGAPELERLAARRPLGASDLHRALSWLGDRLPEPGGGRGVYPRVLLVTDGVATAGEVEARALRRAVRALGDRGVERLDVLAVGGLRDDAALRELVTGNLAHDGQRIDASMPLTEIARRLTLASRSGIAVAVEGAEWVWPETLDGVQPGDQALVFADLPADRPLRVSLDGHRVELDGTVADAERPLLERAWVQARIERLLHLRETLHAGDPDLGRALALQVTELSVRHRVLSPYTALLVLETDGDYRRFGLERTALADVLTVGAGGLEVLARTPPPTAVRAAVPKPRQAVDDFGGLPEGNARIAEPEPPEELLEALAELGPEGPVAGAPRLPEPLQEIPRPRARRVEEGVDVAEQRIAEEIVVEARRRGLGRAFRPSSIAASAPLAEPEPGPSGTAADREGAEPWSGRYAEVQAALDAGRPGAARELAESWLDQVPGDLLALLALGEANEAAGDGAAAARAYGSLIDLFPGRADLRRLAGERLEAIGGSALELAIDTYAKAAADRPDHPSGHRLLAWALLRAGRPAEAFGALETGLDQRYPAGRFAGVDRVLREDLALIGAAWLRAEPARRDEVESRLVARGARLDREPSLRFVLTWETDANDVDLHVRDRRGGHAYYERPKLPSGGELYADVTTGYGPECFTVPEPDRRAAAPYSLAVHYFRRGPMGYGMGTVQVIAHDGRGGIDVESRPFVAMADDAMVELGEVPAPKLAARR